MNCKCGANVATKQMNGTVKFECGGYLFTNGAQSCPNLCVGPDNRDKVLKVYREMGGIQLDHSEYLESLKKSESLRGKLHCELSKDGSVGAWRNRNRKVVKTNWKV